MTEIVSPFAQFFGTNGAPLNNGNIYIGTAYLDAQTNAIPVYWDDALTIPALQPIRTLNGYAVRSGAPARIFCNAANFSMTVQTSTGRTVWAVQDATSVNIPSISGPDGSSQVGFIQAGAGAEARTAQAKMRDIVSVKDYGATGDGVTNDAAAIQAAIDSLSLTGGFVCFNPGTYIISTKINLRPNVTLIAPRGSVVIKQAAAANLTILFDLSTYGATGACFDGLIIDGNRSNNNNNIAVQRHAFWLYDTNDVSIENCEIKEVAGTAVTGRNCLNPVIRKNYIHDCLGYGIGIAPAAFMNNRPIIENNCFSFISWHTIGLINCYHTGIKNNQIETFKVVGQTVTVSGSTATWVSGPNFNGVRPGNFLIYDSGREALIMSVDSPTQLTLQGAPVGAVAVAAACGAADIVNVQASSSTLIDGNWISGGAVGGIVVWADAGQTTASTLIQGNHLEGIGGAAINLQQYGAGSFVLETQIANNLITDAGLDGAAILADYRNGINMVGTGVITTTVSGNTVRAYSASMDGMNIITAGVEVRAANNFFQGMLTNIVNGASIALSAGWNGSTVSNTIVTEDTISFLVTTTATPPAASPTITLTHRVLPMRAKTPSCQMVTTSATVLQMLTQFPDGANTSTFIVSGTPAASATYRFVVRL